MTFDCPQCHRAHAEPRDAAFVIAVVCDECADVEAYEIALAVRAAVVARHAA